MSKFCGTFLWDWLKGKHRCCRIYHSLKWPFYTFLCENMLYMHPWQPLAVHWSRRAHVFAECALFTQAWLSLLSLCNMLIVLSVSMPNWLWKLHCLFSTSPLLYVHASQAVAGRLFHVCVLERFLHPLYWHNSWEFSSAGQSKKINAKIQGWTNTDKARKRPCSKSLAKQRWPMSATGGYAASHSPEVLSRPSDLGRIFFHY